MGKTIEHSQPAFSVSTPLSTSQAVEAAVRKPNLVAMPRATL